MVVVRVNFIVTDYMVAGTVDKTYCSWASRMVTAVLGAILTPTVRVRLRMMHFIPLNYDSLKLT